MRSIFPRLYDLAEYHRVGKTVMTYTGVSALKLGDKRMFWKLLVCFSSSCIPVSPLPVHFLGICGAPDVNYALCSTLKQFF